MMKKLVYLKTIVIVHGKSEKQICQYVKNNLMKLLNNKKFKSYNFFIRNFEDVELIKDGKNLSDDFKIFIIMDTDDCVNDEQRTKYRNKEMFKNHWAYKYIVPIHNTPELETILTKAKVPFKKVGKNRKKEYIKLFPTNDKYGKSDAISIEELMKNLSTVKDTNFEEFFQFCLEAAE